MINSRQGLPRLPEAHHQQVKEAWPLPTDEACPMFQPEDQVDIKVFGKKHMLSPPWEGPYEVLPSEQKRNLPGFLQAMPK